MVPADESEQTSMDSPPPRDEVWPEGALEAAWDFDDPAGSEGRLRRMVTSGAAEAGAVAGTQVARALGLQGRFDEGHRLLDGLASTSTSPEVCCRVALERGRLLRSAALSHGEQTDPRAAVAFVEAGAVAQAAGLERLHLDALHMQAIDAAPPESIRIGEHALALARSARTPGARHWEGSLLHNLGFAHHAHGDVAAALVVFEEAVEVRRAAGQEPELRIARWAVGWTLRLLGRIGEARTVQRALQEELTALGEHDPYVEEELTLLSLSEHDDSARDAGRPGP